MEIDYTRYYTKFHKENEKHKLLMFDYYEKNVNRFLPFDKNELIIDIGCGTGIFIEYLKFKGYKNISGVEIDKGQVEECQKKGLNVVHIEDTIYYLNSQLNKYNIIFCFDVIEHIKHDLQLVFVNSIYKSLKNKGLIICSVPNANSPVSMRWRYNDWTHHFSFTEHSLDFLLFNGGFENIEIHTMEFTSKGLLKKVLKLLIQKPMRLFNRLQLISELGLQGLKIPLSPNIMAVASRK